MELIDLIEAVDSRDSFHKFHGALIDDKECVKDMRKKILLLIVLVCPVMNFFSCEECDRGAPYFDINGLECQILYNSPDKLSDGSFNKLTNGQEAVPFNGHYINVHFEANYYSDLKKTFTQFAAHVAYADECYESPGYAGSEEGLDTLYV